MLTGAFAISIKIQVVSDALFLRCHHDSRLVTRFFFLLLLLNPAFLLLSSSHTCGPGTCGLISEVKRGESIHLHEVQSLGIWCMAAKVIDIYGQLIIILRVAQKLDSSTVGFDVGFKALCIEAVTKKISLRTII